MRTVLLVLIKSYKKLVSPLLKSSCRFYPTCSQYSYDSIEKFGAAKGLWLSAKRIIKCSPLHPGGIDEVPDKFHFFHKHSRTQPDAGVCEH